MIKIDNQEHFDKIKAFAEFCGRTTVRRVLARVV